MVRVIGVNARVQTASMPTEENPVRNRMSMTGQLEAPLTFSVASKATRPSGEPSFSRMGLLRRPTATAVTAISVFIAAASPKVLENPRVSTSTTAVRLVPAIAPSTLARYR